jgi:hypothetical protein
MLITQPLQLEDAGSLGNTPATVASMKRYEAAPFTTDQLNVGEVDTSLPIGLAGVGADRMDPCPKATTMLVRCSAGGALPRSRITFALYVAGTA